MISFENAIDSATTNAKSLIKNADNFVLEGVLLSDDNKLYEVSLSYDIKGKDLFNEAVQDKALAGNSGLLQLAAIMGYRREYRVFLVDSKSGRFKGFKNQKNR